MFATWTALDPFQELAQALQNPWRETLLEEIDQLQSWCQDRLEELVRPWPQAGDLAQHLGQAYAVLAESALLFLEAPEEEAEQMVDVLEAVSETVTYVRESLEDLREVHPLLA